MTITTVKRQILLLAVVLVTACSSQQQPQWLDQPEARYSPQLYLTAQGEADDRSVAADRARANLAKIFRVAINEKSTDSSSSTIAVTPDAHMASVSSEQKVTRDISSEVREVVQGAKVTEYWQDASGRYHALAILEKNAAAKRFRDQIGELDRHTESLLSYASTEANNPVSALSALTEAEQSQQQRDAANVSLSVVSPNVIPAKESAASIASIIRNALSSLPLSVTADDPGLKEDIERAANSLGIKTRATARYRLTGRLDLGPATQQQGWYWLRGSCELILKDNDMVIAKQRWPVKVGALEENVAQQRSRDLMNQELPKQLFELLTSTPVKI